MIVENFPSCNFFGLFVVCPLVEFHLGPFNSGFLIMVKNTENIAVHLGGAFVLFVFPVTVSVLKEPFSYSLIMNCVLKTFFRLRIFVVLKKGITLFIVHSCHGRLVNEHNGCLEKQGAEN